MNLHDKVKWPFCGGKYFTTTSDENMMVENLDTIIKKFNFSTSEIDKRKDGIYYKLYCKEKRGNQVRSIEGGFHKIGDINVLSVHYNMKNERELEFSLSTVLVNLITQLVLHKLNIIIPRKFMDVIIIIMGLALLISLLVALGLWLYNITNRLRIINAIREEFKQLNKIKFREYNKLMNDSIVEQFTW